MKNNGQNSTELSQDQLVARLSALGSPQRLALLGALMDGRKHVSQLAREVGMSRPLTHMHLKLLEKAGLVSGVLEVSKDGKAMKFFTVEPFIINITPDSIKKMLTGK